jgi:hypothetical protein
MQSEGSWLRRATRSGDTSTSFGELAVLLGLTGFAISQPLLAVLGDEPTWFTFRGAGRAEIVGFAVVVALVPPLGLWAAGRLLRRASRSLGWWFHVGAAAFLAGLAVLQIAAQAGLPGVGRYPAAVIAGAGFGAAYASVRVVGLWTRYTSILPALAVGSFLLTSPTGDLVRATSDGAARAAEASDAPSVLMLMLDELPTQSLLARDGSIDRVRFPNFARLADEGTWYPSNSTPASFTSAAIPSILSSTTPTVTSPFFTDHPNTLFTLLAPTHEMRVSENLTQLCPPELCPDLDGEGASWTSVLTDLVTDAAGVWRTRVSRDEPDGLYDDFAPEIVSIDRSSERAPLGAEGITRLPGEYAHLLGSIRPVDQPTLWYAHLMLPHQPWVLAPDGSEYTTPPIFSLDARNERGPWIASVSEQRHLLQLQYTDALVGLALDALDEAGEADDTIVVVTSDHGVSLVPNTSPREAAPETVSQLAYAPLLMRAPGGEPAERGTNVLSLDLLPTLAEMLGIQITWDIEGHPIGSPRQLERGPEKQFYDFGDAAQALERVIEFDHRTEAPTIADRWVGSIGPDDGPIDGLLDTLDVDPWLGRSIAELADGEADASAQVDAREDLRDPPRVPPGVAVVRLTGDLRPDDVVLLELNGRIVTAAPYTFPRADRATAHLLLPPGALQPSGNDVDVALLRGGRVLRLAAG